ncbi:aminoglycoside phosphotransferase (APT) family kinase protein [Kribbella voronezhensis]|uniref:Aminoglycoside phosphotransferase (APT) family kinase protein n=1 Tax=Kribbella voronezhensis TaxID=2512212 RepID=A0A4R7T4B6_9ACTN|nr:aminoglycoside phosphotransferase family protein [Kribbella voronezhensis]TDU86652.1 aminoglycoside phosphotransferase (APT) family kinase protein [Kribbella voronezhensis]
MDETPEVLPLPDRKPADGAVARRLIDAQFPQWSDLEIRPVDAQGWDNRTFRLGDELLVRLPTAQEYALAVDKEHRWLPVLTRAVPLEIPEPVGRGVPDENFAHDWSVYRWIGGEPADRAVVDDLTTFGVELAEFLVALQQVDPTGGPVPGLHNWFRGGPLTTYDGWARSSLKTLDGLIPTEAAEEIWDRALRAPWDGRAVWFHGDIAAGNLLMKDRALSAVIDFGTCGVGDPACDLAVAWTMLTGESRAAFRDRLAVDDATWLRGQGWALWKALVVCAGSVRDGDGLPADAAYVLDQILAAHEHPR